MPRKGAVQVSAWKHQAIQEVTLFSGAGICRQRGATLPELIRGGRIPNEWLGLAVKIEYAADGVKLEELDPKDVQEFEEFRNWLIAETVQEPRLTPADVAELPGLDRNQLWQVALHGFDAFAGIAKFRAAAGSPAASGNGSGEELPTE